MGANLDKIVFICNLFKATRSIESKVLHFPGNVFAEVDNIAIIIQNRELTIFQGISRRHYASN